MEKEEHQEKISNLSAIKGGISNFDKTREKDASDIEFMNKTEDGMISFIDNSRSMNDL